MATTIWGVIFAFSSLSVAHVNGQFEVAFSAGLTHHLTLLGEETVIFDTAFTNIGNSYNTTTGKFTCPMAGIYVFQFHGLSRNGAVLYLELYHDDYYVASAYSHNNGDWAAAGNDVILHLNKGDTVYVKDAYDQVSQLYGDDGEVYCTFSGYLISPFFQEPAFAG